MTISADVTTSNRVEPCDLILPKAATDVLISRINEIKSSALGESGSENDFAQKALSECVQIPALYMESIIKPAFRHTLEECKTTFPQHVKELLVTYVKESVRRSGGISFKYVENTLRDKGIQKYFQVTSIVAFTPKFDSNNFAQQTTQRPMTIGSAMPDASKVEISAVANAYIRIKSVAMEQATEFEGRILTQLKEIFTQVDQSQQFLPFFKISKNFHGFKGLHRSYLLKLLKEEMEKHVEKPEIYKVYEEAIALFRDKTTISKKDFKEMVGKFPRDEIQTQALIIDEINRSAASHEYIELSGDDLDTAIRKIEAREHLGVDIMHEDSIKSEAYRIYRYKTITQPGFQDSQWEENAVAKTKQFVEDYSNSIILKIVEYMRAQKSVTYFDVRVKTFRECANIQSANLESAKLESANLEDEQIVRTSSEIESFIVYRMLRNIFTEVILNPNSG